MSKPNWASTGRPDGAGHLDWSAMAEGAIDDLIDAVDELPTGTDVEAAIDTALSEPAPVAREGSGASTIVRQSVMDEAIDTATDELVSKAGDDGLLIRSADEVDVIGIGDLPYSPMDFVLPLGSALLSQGAVFDAFDAGHANANRPAIIMPGAAPAAPRAMWDVDLPAAWNTFRIVIDWSTAAASPTGDVKFEARVDRHDVGGVLAATALGVTAATSVGAQRQRMRTVLPAWSRTHDHAGLMVFRRSDQAEDTHDSDIGILRVAIVEAP